MTDSINDAMREMGQQSDPMREMLRRMLAEFGDQHYEQCPANWIEGHENHGPCNCFAGHLVKDALATLAAQQDGASDGAWKAYAIRLETCLRMVADLSDDQLKRMQAEEGLRLVSPERPITEAEATKRMANGLDVIRRLEQNRKT